MTGIWASMRMAAKCPAGDSENRRTASSPFSATVMEKPSSVRMEEMMSAFSSLSSATRISTGARAASAPDGEETARTAPGAPGASTVSAVSATLAVSATSASTFSARSAPPTPSAPSALDEISEGAWAGVSPSPFATVGSVTMTVKQEPHPGSLSTVMEPPICVMSR